MLPLVLLPGQYTQKWTKNSGQSIVAVMLKQPVRKTSYRCFEKELLNGGTLIVVISDCKFFHHASPIPAERFFI